MSVIFGAYRAFQAIIGRAGRDYVPARAEFPITVVQIDHSDVGERVRELGAEVTVFNSGGMHLTMLLPQHVAGVFEAVDRARLLTSA